MSAYLVRRLLLILPTLLGASVLAFSMVRMLPGDAVAAEATDFNTDLAGLRHQLGLDVPYPIAYLRWLQGVGRGDFGRSLRDSSSVSQGIADHLPATVELGILATVISFFIALPVGVLSAVMQDSAFDQAARAVATLLTAVPFFWTSVLVLTWGSIWFGWAPPTDYRQIWQDPLGNLEQMVVPAVILGTAITGALMRVTRTEMLEVIRQDYIRTARAKGLGGRAIVLRHGLRNASLPIVTVITLQLPILIGGAVIAETLFVLPGMGRYLLLALGHRDYPIIQGVVLILALMVSLTNLGTDLMYGVLDPRLKLR